MKVQAGIFFKAAAHPKKAQLPKHVFFISGHQGHTADSKLVKGRRTMQHHIKQWILCVSALAFMAPAQAEDLLITGKIYTAERDQSSVEAVLISDGRFSHIGSLREVETAASSDHRRIDLGSNVAYPGFIEGHGHLASFGKAALNLDLNKANSYDDIISMVADATTRIAAGQVIEGRGWHQSKWSKDPKEMVDGFPTHKALSEVSPNHPVVLGHANGHSALANEAAMRALGINFTTDAPEGGVIVKDQRGNPTGILHENAMDLLAPLTAFSEASAKNAIGIAQAQAFKWGITSFHDAGAGATEVDALLALDASGDLKLRVYSMISAQDESLTEYWINRAPVRATGDQRLTLASFKAVMDGALGSRTAWLHAPYTDDTGTSGVQTFDTARLVEIMKKSGEHGWQINTHAIGDKANTVVLDAIEAAKLGTRDHRSRIEHSQHLVPDDIARFAQLGVIASIQTVHMSSDRPWAIDRLGKDRIESGAYVWRDLLNAGVHLANGTDVPVEPINPLANFYAAVARKTLKGTPEEGYEYHQRLSREEALQSMTLWNAYAAFQEDDLGSVVVGKRADLTILNQDIMTVTDADILTTGVAMTIVDGEIVYTAQRQ